MQAVTRFLLVLCLVCGLQAMAVAVTGPVPPGIKEEVARTIVRVRSGTKYSTGFFWRDGRTVLTTLHSLSSGGDIEVYIPAISGWRSARLRKVYRGGDLISLEVQQYASPHYLSQHYTSRPPVDTRVFTVGYNGGSAAYIDRDFSVGLLQGNRLADLLPVAARQEIQALGFPSLAIQIIYLQGSLLHGFSGAPVVDQGGRLVGVADGGLENGAADISWCIHASHISQLETSNETLPSLNSPRLRNLFAYEEYQAPTESVEYTSLGNFRFRRIKTRSFSQLDFTGKYSTSDAMGLQQLLSFFSNYGYNLGQFRYDIYLEESTGATVVVPEGETLRQENGKLVCGDNRIRLYIDLQVTNNIQYTSQVFEGTFNHPAINWMADVAWTYPMPFTGPTGSIIRRKAFMGNGQQYYLFEALAGKAQYFLGAAAFRNSMQMAPADYEQWAQYAIAIQLTSFSN
ncbi:S1 family peptidase [Chitinophaga japonensis]|uniref:Trypsin-like peptidase n=1 Tax=Chitinophaga japonensis TaxID=104662 RepID=A0A562SS29_CHIJA|nr:serine protease [Chitinophaga japonensis]TWI84067.1 trypsin-like peptidase [Chitinophaga japonensis]